MMRLLSCGVIGSAVLTTAVSGKNHHDAAMVAGREHIKLQTELTRSARQIVNDRSSDVALVTKLDASPTGYYYLRAFSDKHCTSETATFGYAVDHCFVEDNFAFKYMISSDDDGTCNTLQVYNYIDDQCNTLISISETTPVSGRSGCIGFDTSISEYATEACTTSSEPPAAVDGAIMMYSNNDGDCNQDTAGFLQLVGCQKLGSNSYESSCTATGEPQYSHWSNSKKCQGSATEVFALPNQCTAQDSYFFFDPDSNSESDPDSSSDSSSSDSASQSSSDSTSDSVSDSSSDSSSDSEDGKSGEHLRGPRDFHNGGGGNNNDHNHHSSSESSDSSVDGADWDFDSEEWVTASPSASTTAFPTSVNASIVNVKYVCGSAPTAVPTQAPTVNDLVTFDVEQVLNDFDMDNYEQNIALYDQVLIETIAATMQGVSSDNILDFEIESNEEDNVDSGEDTQQKQKQKQQQHHQQRQGQGQGRSLRHTRRLNHAVTAEYTVMVRNASLSYATLSAELEQAISSGTFDDMLAQNAAASGLTALQDVTSDAVSTQNVQSGDSSSSGGGGGGGGGDGGGKVGIIVGVVIAVILVLAVISVAVCCIKSRRSEDGSCGSSTNATTTGSAAAAAASSGARVGRHSQEETAPLTAQVLETDSKHFEKAGNVVTAEMVAPAATRYPPATVTTASVTPPTVIAPATLF